MKASFWCGLAVAGLGFFAAEPYNPAEARLGRIQSSAVAPSGTCAGGSFTPSATKGTCDDVDCCGGEPQDLCGPQVM